MKPKTKRNHIVRRYDGVYVLLRKLFKVPEDEMILDFIWDKHNGELVLTTLKD